MANTFPVADTAGVVEQVWRLGRESGYCDVQPVGAVTVGLEGKQLAELGAMHDSAAGVRVFSDDGKCVDDAVIMRRALEYVKAFDGVIAQHAQEPRLTEGAQMNEGIVSAELGLGGWPAVAEESIIARDVLLAAHVGSRVHICHLSTAGSVEIIRWAKSKGWNVTAEVTPHHLLLTDELVRSYNPIYKVNPPLRTEADVLALREALADGTIDCVATDHAPHPHEDKDCEWAAAAMGMVGLETALSVVQHTMVDTGLIDWAGVADRMSVRPAQIGRLAGHGRPVSAGEPANLTLVDPAYRGVVDPRASPPAAATPPTRAASCRDVSPTPSCGAVPRSSTGIWRERCTDQSGRRAEVGGGDRLVRPYRLGGGSAHLHRAGVLADAPGLEVAREPPVRSAGAAPGSRGGGARGGTAAAQRPVPRLHDRRSVAGPDRRPRPRRPQPRGADAHGRGRGGRTARGHRLLRTGRQLRAARLDKGIAGKVLAEGGLLILTWQHGERLLDSGFRSDRAAEHTAWVEAVNLMNQSIATDHTPTTDVSTAATSDAPFTDASTAATDDAPLTTEGTAR